MIRMRRVRKEPALVWRQRCPACGSILPQNAKVPYAEPGGADLLEQQFAGRGKIVNIRTLSYLGEGQFENAFRARWVERLQAVLAKLLGRGVAGEVRAYRGARLRDVVELRTENQPRYVVGDMTFTSYAGLKQP